MGFYRLIGVRLCLQLLFAIVVVVVPGKLSYWHSGSREQIALDRPSTVGIIQQFANETTCGF